jgi:PKD domain
LPFQIDMAVNRTSAAPGDTLVVLVNAQGGNIINMIVEFGDGGIEAFPTGGARTAQALFPHPFTTAGDYKIKATVTDSDDGDKADSVVVHIQ